MNIVRADQHVSIQRVIDLIDQIKQQPAGQTDALVCLLSENHPIYRNRSANQTSRLRGYAMSAFATITLPQRALPYVLESLESAFHPYLVAGAARSLRGMRKPHPQTAGYLIKAILNIWQNDQPVSFEQYHVEWPLDQYSTAVSEILKALAELGSFARGALCDLEHLSQSLAPKFSPAIRAQLQETIQAIVDDDRKVPDDCCDLPTLLQQVQQPDSNQNINCVPPDLVVEDQDGQRMMWSTFFGRKPTVLAFFYTRCANPRKCMQTIFNLTAIQGRLAMADLEGKVQIAAVTYDSQHDNAAALRSYGNARQFRFDDNCRMLRVPVDFGKVIQAFDLGVNFTGSQVNMHRIELFILDRSGQIVRSFLRIQSEPQKVVDTLASLTSKSAASQPAYPPSISGLRHALGDRGRLHTISSMLLAVLVAFFPKCPMCWFSYLSILGVAGAESIPYSPWLMGVLVALLLANLYFLYRSAQARNGYLPFALSLAGSAALLLMNPQVGLPRWLIAPGFVLLACGSLLQSMGYRRYNKLRLKISELRFRLQRRLLGLDLAP